MAEAIKLNVTGMTCDHCVHAVTEAIKDVPGVTAAVVDLAAKSAEVEGEGIDLEKVLANIKEEGYEATVV